MADKVLRVEIVGDAAALQAAFRRASSEAETFGGKMQAIGSRTAAVGKTLTRDLTLPIVGLGVASVKMASDFQSSMELIHTQANVSQKAVDAMSKSVLQMAPSVGTGPETLSQGLFHLASQGLRGAAAMQALRIAAEGAKVGQANLEDVTNALGAVLVSGVKGSQNYSQAMGALNAVVGAGDMHMQDLADAMGTGLPAKAAIFGVSLTQAGAALAVFGDNNIRGAEAGTLFNSTLRVMGAESGKAAKVLATIGIGQTQLAQDMRSPGGLVTALADLKSHMEKAGLSASEQAALLTHAFGGRQAGGVMILIDQLERLRSKVREVGAGANGFGSAWSATTQTTAFKFDQMKAKLEQVGITLGGKLMPIATQVGGALVGVVGKFDQLSPAMQRIILYGGGIVAALGPVITILGRLSTAIGFMATNPLGLGLAAAAAGGVLAYKVLNDVAQSEQKAGRAAQDAQRWIEGLGNSLHNLHDRQLNAKDASVALAQSHLNLRDATRAWDQVVMQGKTHTEEGVRAYLAMRSAQNDVTRNSETYKAATAAVTAEEKKRWTSLETGRQKTLAAADAFKKILEAKDPIRAMGEGYTAFFNNLGTAISHPIAALEAFRLGSDKAINEGKLSAALGEISRRAFEMGAKLQSSDPQLANTALKVSLYTKAMQTLYDQYNKIPTKKQITAEVKVLGKQGYIRDLADYKAAMKNSGEQAHQAFFVGIGKVVGDATSKVSSAIKAAGNLAGQARGAGRSVGAAFTQGVVGGIAVHAADAVAAELVHNMIASAKAAGQIHSPSERTKREIGFPLMDGVARGVEERMSRVAQAMSGSLETAIREQQAVAAASRVLGAGMAASIANGLQQKTQTVAQQVISTMRAAVQERGDMAAAAQVLGAGQARSIAAGVLGYQPSLTQQLSTALRAAMRQAMQAAQQEVQTDMGSLTSAFDSMKSSILSAFDLIHSAGNTPAGKQLAAMQRQDQIDQAQRAVDQARQQLAKDQASGTATPEQLAADNQAIADALRQQQEMLLGLQSQDQQAQAAQEKNHLEKRLAQLRSELAKHPGEYKKIHREILALLKKAGIDQQAIMGAGGDWDMAQALLGQESAVTAAARKLAQAIAKELKVTLEVKIATSTGTASTATPGGMAHAASGGIFSDVPGGLIRVLEGGHEEGIVSLDPGKRTRSLAIWTQIGKRLNVPGFADGGIPGNPNLDPNATGKAADTPGMRAAAMWIHDAGRDKYDKVISAALIGALGPRAQAQAALRHTYVPGFGELHQGSWRAAAPDQKWVTMLTAAYPGLVLESGSKGQQISAGQALSRITGGLGAVTGLIQASMGLAGTESKISKATSNAFHFEGAGGYLTAARANPYKLTLAGLIKQYPGLASFQNGSGGLGDTGFMGSITGPVPYMAEGGIATRPTFAHIAEHEPEIVAPLSALAGVSRRGGGGDTHYHLHAEVKGPVYGSDKRAIADQLVDEFDSALRRKFRRGGVPNYAT